MADVLWDDGVSYVDYLEQITYLIFLKMCFEYSQPPYKNHMDIPPKYTWDKLSEKSGAELEAHYKKTLEELAKQGGTRVMKMINDENRTAMSSDVKGDIYEGLLQKNAENTKSGAGQYFTPRPLICAMVRCVNPEPGKTIADPCCGSGGFFLAAKAFIEQKYTLDREQKKFLKFGTSRGWEIVPNTCRMCLMNLFLHNVGDLEGRVPVTRNDALLSDPGERFAYVLTNSPFGRKSSMTFTKEKGEQEKGDLVYNRQDSWTTGSNKQIGFIQHIHTMLAVGGTAAVVVPDNVLFEGEAGETIRKKLLETTDLHTILRLPTGIFYANGVKANVLFFENRVAGPDHQTKEVLVYDLRTNMHFALKRNPLTEDMLYPVLSSREPV